VDMVISVKKQLKSVFYAFYKTVENKITQK